MRVTPIRPLSPRQKELAELVATGKSHKLIAAALDISPGRARNAVREIADLLPNPDKLTPYRLVAIYYGHELWLARQQQETSPDVA